MRESWQDVFFGVAENAPNAEDTFRGLIKQRIRKYPPKMFRGLPKWEKDDLESRTDELLQQFLPVLKFLIFSEASTSQIFGAIRRGVSDYMIDQAPVSTKKFINQVSGILKPRYGFVRSIKRGVGLVTWEKGHPITPYSRTELSEIWGKEIKVENWSIKGQLRAKERGVIFQKMIGLAAGWVPKSWFYGGFFALIGGQNFPEVSFDDSVDSFISVSRPNTYSDFEAIKLIKTEQQDTWRSLLERTLDSFSGKARIILYRILLYEESQVVAAKKAGTTSQYANKILQKISGYFSVLMPLEALEMTAFKSFFQEFLFEAERGEFS